jgi:hypothetical protein
MSSLAKLDAVTRAKGAYALAKSTLEARLREELREELRKLNGQLDIAIRYAYDDGHSKAEILRALGTKDFYTLKNSLERTQGVERIEGVNPLDSLYTYDPDGKRLFVSYVDHGPLKINGEAVFDVKVLDDNTTWFMAAVPLWSEDYSVRNDVVAALDGKQDGYYYEEALGWVNEKL